MIKVSVIIPVYNAEKYLSACLESVLNQTLLNFEVIAVDDCSSDLSTTIAESYLKKFGGRMKIIYLPENTGSGAVPRNVGLDFASGKYVFFMDNDDLIVDNTLETLYNLAEKYRTDIIYMEQCFTFRGDVPPKDLKPSIWTKLVLKNKFLFESEDIGERMSMLMTSHFYWPPWTRFLSRTFLIDNNIKFPQMTISDDVIWTIKSFCLAKKLLRIPTPLYIYRSNENSLTSRKRTPEQEIIFWTNPLINGLEILDEFMRDLKFFKNNPVVRLQMLNFFALMQIDNMSEALNQLDPTEIYEIFLREFGETSNPALISYLLVMNNLYRNELRALT